MFTALEKKFRGKNVSKCRLSTKNIPTLISRLDFVSTSIASANVYFTLKKKSFSIVLVLNSELTNFAINHILSFECVCVCVCVCACVCVCVYVCVCVCVWNRETDNWEKAEKIFIQVHDAMNYFLFLVATRASPATASTAGTTTTITASTATRRRKWRGCWNLITLTSPVTNDNSQLKFVGGSTFFLFLFRIRWIFWSFWFPLWDRERRHSKKCRESSKRNN